MPKNYKRTIYEKDNDDHYVVILNPWTRGYMTRSQVQVDWIGAWLRIVFHKPTDRNVVKNIYTVNTRSEVIARISASVNVNVGLGLHRWEEFMEQKHLRRIKRKTEIDLSENVSHIFLYNWALHGDPAERQWDEWFPRQDEIPPDAMIKRDYPEPEWTEIPPSDARLRSFLIPMRIMGNISNDPLPDQTPGLEVADRASPKNEAFSLEGLDQEELKPRKNDVQDERSQSNVDHHARATDASESSSLHEPPIHLRPRQPGVYENNALKHSKVDKLDPYEEDEAARKSLKVMSKERESLDASSFSDPHVRLTWGKIKTEVADVKPSLQDTDEYQPSHALSSAIQQLKNSGKPSRDEESKSIIKNEEGNDIKPDLRETAYQPSAMLKTAISRLNREAGSQEPEDKKPVIKEEGYVPSSSLLEAFSQYSGVSSFDADSSSLAKRDIGDHRAASGALANEPRASKRIKVERS